MKIAILSNVETSVLADLVRARHSVWTAPGFGAWRQTALAVPTDLKEFDPAAVFLAIDPAHGEPAADDAVESAAAALEAALPKANVLVVDVGDLAAERGAAFYDERMWRLAAMPWSLDGLRALADETDRLLGFLKGGAKKVLALDFDNTLWRGIVSEDGIEGIVPDLALQRRAKALQARGVLLVGLSKNNPADLAPVWSDPRMLLKRGDFAAVRVNWNAKGVNLAEVAAELQLGTDAFVFIDDRPVERADMSARLPEVVTGAPEALRHLARLWFPRLRLTDEDRARTSACVAASARRTASAGLSLEAYLASLGIVNEIHPMRADEAPRVAQLSQKSNQFNVRTNRYALDEVLRWTGDASDVVLTLRSRDRFGDLGLVGFVRATVAGARAEIVDFVLSCRAMNRRVEFALAEALEAALRARGVAEIVGRFVPTAKNAPAADLFPRLGYAPEGDHFIRLIPAGGRIGAI